MEKTVLKIVNTFFEYDIFSNEKNEFDKTEWYFFESEKDLVDKVNNIEEYFQKHFEYENSAVLCDFKKFTLEEFLGLDISELSGLKMNQLFLFFKKI